MSSKTYRTKEFASLAGVSVRTLHHYDRLGLLKPHRTAAGYRTYLEKDLALLEQIVSLKFIGIGLRDIRRLLRADPTDFGNVLSAQQTVLEEKRKRLDLAIAVIREARERLGSVDTSGLKRIIEVITMQDEQTEFRRQYDELLQGKVERLGAMTPDAREQLRSQFAELAKEIQGALQEDPAGPHAQELATRWLELLAAFSPKGPIDSQLLKYSAMYLSDAQAPPGATRPEPPYGRAVWEFMARAIAARSQ
jgi:DNA-binding transcriptional MerR regulator